MKYSIAGILSNKISLTSNQCQPLTSSMVAVEYNDDYLVCYNNKRKQWELPGGSIEENESPKDGAIRELLEETNQAISDIKYIGLIKLVDTENNYTEYIALYYSSITCLREFTENEEIGAINLWNKLKKTEQNDGFQMIIDYCNLHKGR